MSLIPIIGVRVMLRVLLRAGYVVVRQVGSHLKLYHPVTKRSITLAIHTGDLTRKMISAMIKQAGLSVAQFLKLLGRQIKKILL